MDKCMDMQLDELKGFCKNIFISGIMIIKSNPTLSLRESHDKFHEVWDRYERESLDKFLEVWDSYDKKLMFQALNEK